MDLWEMALRKWAMGVFFSMKTPFSAGPSRNLYDCWLLRHRIVSQGVMILGAYNFPSLSLSSCQKGGRAR